MKTGRFSETQILGILKQVVGGISVSYAVWIGYCPRTRHARRTERGYNGLVDRGYGHFRVDHSKDEFSRGEVHISGIKRFWGFAKVRPATFKGISNSTLHLYLKETKWRFNHRHSDKYKILLT